MTNTNRPIARHPVAIPDGQRQDVNFKPENERISAMSYVDGFVVPVPKKNVKQYLSIAKKAGKVWKDHGALDYCEAIADDVKPGKWTSFPRSVKLKKNETVIFSYILYKSRAHRDRVLKKVMSDPRLDKMMKDPKNMPFDGKRMIWGGFKTAIML
jgi:uncharacterized protein YbaA (DUF1428 family)